MYQLNEPTNIAIAAMATSIHDEMDAALETRVDRSALNGHAGIETSGERRNRPSLHRMGSAGFGLG